MMTGTFEALCRDPDVYLQNNDTWDRVRGTITGAVLTITAESADATCWVNWLVIAERQDAAIRGSALTNKDGCLILEH